MRELIINLLVIFLFAATCSAQVTTENIFIPEGTLWKIETIQHYPNDVSLGFYAGFVWQCAYGNCTELNNSHYSNMLFSDYSATITTGVSVHGSLIPILGFGNCYVCTTSEDCTKLKLKRISNSFAGTL